MKNSILNLGKALNKAEQKSINGGNGPCGPSGGTILLAKSEPACLGAGGIWLGGKCWVCFG